MATQSLALTRAPVDVRDELSLTRDSSYTFQALPPHGDIILIEAEDEPVDTKGHYLSGSREFSQPVEVTIPASPDTIWALAVYEAAHLIVTEAE